jgi:hypothetical protein
MWFVGHDGWATDKEMVGINAIMASLIWSSFETFSMRTRRDLVNRGIALSVLLNKSS